MGKIKEKILKKQAKSRLNDAKLVHIKDKEFI